MERLTLVDLVVAFCLFDTVENHLEARSKLLSEVMIESTGDM